MCRRFSGSRIIGAQGKTTIITSDGRSMVSLQDSDNFAQGGRYANDVQTACLGWSNPVGVCDFLWCEL
jgi:hypothetical protein